MLAYICMVGTGHEIVKLINPLFYKQFVGKIRIKFQQDILLEA